jgi:hypothetical protein
MHFYSVLLKSTVINLARVLLTLCFEYPLLSPDTVELGGTELGRFSLSFSAGSSKIKILNSLASKASYYIYIVAVRILIFDDPAENERGNVPQGSVNCQTRVARAARAARMEKIYETLRMPPARAPGAGSVLVK